jgi:hypothetical protein
MHAYYGLETTGKETRSFVCVALVFMGLGWDGTFVDLFLFLVGYKLFSLANFAVCVLVLNVSNH